MRNRFFTSLMLTGVLINSPAGLAGPVGELTTFTAGSAAKASEVNENFSAVKTAVDDNDARVAALEKAVATLLETIEAQQTAMEEQQETLAVLEADVRSLGGQVRDISSSSVMALAPYLTVTDIKGPPRATLSGINLQLVNGTGNTDSANGLGNLLIGYDLVRTDGGKYCSDGNYDDVTARTHETNVNCTGSGATWAVSHKTGSHYLVIGDYHNYSQYGGLVAGHQNNGLGRYAVVSGGAWNTASGLYSSVSGGSFNTASGIHSSVSGGSTNIASGRDASVSGGFKNKASGSASSVSGGTWSSASGDVSSVSGGDLSTASGAMASVTGGQSNTASGWYSSVTGGNNNTASGAYDRQ